MNLPSGFKFKTLSGVFNAKLEDEGYRITDGGNGGGVLWGKKQVIDNVKNGVWKITKESDNVNHPSHYQGKTEVIDIIEQATTDLNGFHAYCLGNVIKYVMRHQKKGGIEDLKKASWYLNRVIEADTQ